MSRGPRKSRTLGAWLALLALYVQVLLPMLIAVELRLADARGPASAAFAMCGGHGSTGAPDGGAAGAPGTGDSHPRHCCPLCTAIGASYIAAGEISLAVPASWTSIILRASGLTVVPRSRVAIYEARAPPAIHGLKPVGWSLDRPNGAYLVNAKFIPVHARKSCLPLPIDAA